MPKQISKEDALQKVITCRLHRNLVDRLDELIPIFQEDHRISPNANSGRSHVIRVLLEKALIDFEGTGDGK